jgi:serine/threonine-protein kinase
VVAAIGFFGAGLDATQMLAGWLLAGVAIGPETGLIPLATNLATCAASLALFLLAHGRRIPHPRLLDLTLVYEIFLCALISLVNPASAFEDGGALPNLTWVTPLIILFPLLVPVPPRRMLVTALLAASTRPLALLLHDSLGTLPVAGENYLSASFSPALAVGMAYFGSRVIHGMGVQVAEARRAGSYELERLLGRGGMGEVWLAHHRMLARPAAVKLVSPEFLRGAAGGSVDTVLRRFEREARATAALRSPHTVGVYDFGVTEPGAFYYVMELLDGLDADSLVRRFGPLPAERALYLLRQVGHSLAEAHERGLVHRDVKPANLFVCRYGRDVDFVKVLDFGLVQAIAPSGEEIPHLTVEGSVGGTPAFMAPEQALGRETDARSDLYAVGGVAHWLLTGRLPFEGATPLEMATRHVSAEPEPPSRGTELPISEAVDRLVLDCLAKDPGRRPRTAIELIERIDACRVDPAWTEERARRWWATSLPPGPDGPDLPHPLAGSRSPR